MVANLAVAEPCGERELMSEQILAAELLQYDVGAGATVWSPKRQERVLIIGGVIDSAAGAACERPRLGGRERRRLRRTRRRSGLRPRCRVNFGTDPHPCEAEGDRDRIRRKARLPPGGPPEDRELK